MDSSQIDFKKYQSILDKYQIFVWDFDYTLLKIHAYNQGLKASDVEGVSWRKLQNLHFSDAIFFRDLVAYLIKNGKKVAVISFGTFNVIKTYLDRLFGGEPIFGLHNIYTPLEGNRRYDGTLRPSSNKNQYLIDLVRSHPGTNYKDVLFFDDSKHILKDAEDDLGIEGVLVEKGVGFTRATMDFLLEKLKLSVPEKGKKLKAIKKNFKKILKKDKKDLVEGFTTQEDESEGFDLVEGFNKAFQVSDRTMLWINVLAILLVIFYFWNR